MTAATPSAGKKTLNGNIIKVLAGVAIGLITASVLGIAAHMLNTETHQDQRTKDNNIRVIVQQELHVHLAGIKRELAAIRSAIKGD